MPRETVQARGNALEETREPRAMAAKAESYATLPKGIEERFAGWGVMGVTFHSGDVLAMRRFPASSLGSGYSSVWHRGPSGAWTIWSDTPPLESCARYFGAELTRAVQTRIDIDWHGSRRLRVAVPSASLSWTIALGANAATQTLNVMSRAMPDAAWRNPTVLGVMARLAGPMLHAGSLGLSGHAPNGQSFAANPMTIWVVEESGAMLDGRDFGRPEPLATQAKLGDFWIPQRGLFAMGRAFFEPADPSRHHLVAAGRAPS